MQELSDSFGWPVAIGLFVGFFVGLVIKNFYTGLTLGFVGAIVYVFYKHKERKKGKAKGRKKNSVKNYKK